MVDRLYVGLVMPKLFVVATLCASAAITGTVVIAADQQTPGTAALPPAKQAMLDKINAIRAQGKPAPKDPSAVPQDQAQVLPDVGGAAAGIGRLFSDAETMRPPGYPDDRFTNSWSVVSQTLNLDVWAGVHASGDMAGFLLVVVWNADRTQLVASHEYVSAGKGGALHILGATAATLSLADDAGNKLSFDTAAGAFGP